jgi:hypothetical protein
LIRRYLKKIYKIERLGEEHARSTTEIRKTHKEDVDKLQKEIDAIDKGKSPLSENLKRLDKTLLRQGTDEKPQLTVDGEPVIQGATDLVTKAYVDSKAGEGISQNLKDIDNLITTSSGTIKYKSNPFFNEETLLKKDLRVRKEQISEEETDSKEDSKEDN